MTKRDTSGFFSSYSASFSAIYGTGNGFIKSLINRYFRRSMLERYEKTITACQPIQGKTVLDIGCGPGHYSLALAKQGAGRILGIDFAPGMIELAQTQAKTAGLGNKCEFRVQDFFQLSDTETFDYVILMGFMDYIGDPERLIAKVTRLTQDRAVFSFPAAGGFLAWQRKLRYRFKCPLYLYSEAQIDTLFSGLSGWNYRIEKISRDFFVTLSRQT